MSIQVNLNDSALLDSLTVKVEKVKNLLRLIFLAQAMWDLTLATLSRLENWIQTQIRSNCTANMVEAQYQEID